LGVDRVESIDCLDLEKPVPVAWLLHLQALPFWKMILQRTPASRAPVIPSKRLRIMDEFEDEESDSNIVAIGTKYLSSSERPTDAERADPLLYWKNSNCVELASVARIYIYIYIYQPAHRRFRVKVCFMSQD
jgi:hypothetical protein